MKRGRRRQSRGRRGAGRSVRCAANPPRSGTRVARRSARNARSLPLARTARTSASSAFRARQRTRGVPRTLVPPPSTPTYTRIGAIRAPALRLATHATPTLTPPRAAAPHARRVRRPRTRQPHRLPSQCASFVNPVMYIQYCNRKHNPNPRCATAAGRRACSTEGFAPQTTPPTSSGACTNTQRQSGQPRPRHHSIHFSVTHCAQARSRSRPRHHATSLPSQMSGKHERSCACTPLRSDAAMASARRRSGNRGMPCAGDLWGGGCAGARVDERALSAPAPHTWHAVPSTASAAYNAS